MVRSEIGQPFPLGATPMKGGVNFSVYSKNSTAVELLLFKSIDEAAPSLVISLDPKKNRTYHYWHIFLSGLQVGQIYGYRVHGPYEPSRGLRFNGAKLLLDPYAKAVAIPKIYSRQAACGPQDNTPEAMKGIVVDRYDYDWDGDKPLYLPFSKTVIYEMHVRGFTMHPSSGVAEEKRGTFAGLIEKIPYLKELGVTAVELLPIFQFDPEDCPPGLVNYWGYSPVSFFAPHQSYSSRKDWRGPLDEFRDMVKALHKAGIEVLLDVVFNHTAEGNHEGPTFSFRGFENRAYYILDADQKYFANYAGTGNTFNANNAITRRLILDSLRYWVKHMHVDGFRFDLASILARDTDGRVLENPPILWDIESDPVLAGIKLIAEAWDAGGLYQVGRFIGDSWKEWNGPFRDDVRLFLRGDENVATRFANRLLGSPDLYAKGNREPEKSVNFVTCHDGFTLNDLVSYNTKHNEVNGEENRDGMPDNGSWNCGVEGPTEDAGVEALRRRQIKNFFAINLLAMGVPMVLMGDEVRRTQKGNNNAYCQDNDLSWFDWSLVQKNSDIHRFATELIQSRFKRTSLLSAEGATLAEILKTAKIEWHGVALDKPDWTPASHTISCTITSQDGPLRVHILVNAYLDALTFELPPPSPFTSATWREWINTSKESPFDIVPWADAKPIGGSSITVPSRTVVVLFF